MRSHGENDTTEYRTRSAPLSRLSILNIVLSRAPYEHKFDAQKFN